MARMIRLTRVWYDHPTHTMHQAPMAIVPAPDMQITKDKEGHTTVSCVGRKPITVAEDYEEVLERLGMAMDDMRIVHVHHPNAKPYPALFHRWHVMDDDDGQRFPVGIVERDDGSVALVYAEHVHFMDRGVHGEADHGAPEDGTPEDATPEGGTVA